MDILPYRQIHLDFHTSEAITGIGADFDAEAFADRLSAAHVNSINLFARGHHGWVYYESEAFPELRHPHLETDLLTQQVAACHRHGIKAPIYITVQWDHRTANLHPEWLVVDEHGKPKGTGLYEAGFYRFLCLNTPYVDFLRAFTKDVLDTLPVDGLWFDIVWAHDCSCPWCRSGMIAEGLDPADAAQRAAWGKLVLQRFTLGMTEFVRELSPDCLVFYNRGHVGPAVRPMLDAYTHLELESLPSGGWGYLHFPTTARYARTLGKQFLGMTGKFHTAWGDFHSYKNQAALEFECFLMLALNGQCCVGDQLPPRGVLCPVTYELVGNVYEQVEAREPWCAGAKALADVAVMNPEAFGGDGGHAATPESLFGAVRMLQECQVQFDVVDPGSELTGYRLLVLPDDIPVNPDLAAKIEAFVNGGGGLLASHRAGLSPAGAGFALACLGLHYEGDAEYSPDFVVPEGPVAGGLPAIEHVMYQRGSQVTPKGAEVLSWVHAPYFNRTWEHFCSHRHTPSSGARAYPAVTRHGQCLYFAHPLFSQYQHNSPLWCRRLLEGALGLLLPEPRVRVEGPSALIVTLNEQAAEQRLVLHLLFYVPERRSRTIDVIEDVYPLTELPVTVHEKRQVKSVRCVPDGDDLPFTQRNEAVCFTLPRLLGHQMIELALA